MSEFRYKAFISYSHADETWARWLHRSIEAYRLPKNLIGSHTPLGKVPARIRPVFRDRDELSSAADLGSTVTQALSDSENLIVICSPAAAASHWVREEIREFVRLGRRDRIFCIIVDGEASASGSVAAAVSGCDRGGGYAGTAGRRRTQVGGRQAVGKTEADFRHARCTAGPVASPGFAKAQKDAGIGTGSGESAVIAIIIIAITGRMAAEQRRDSGELLVGYKLNELRTMLSQAGEPEKPGASAGME